MSEFIATKAIRLDGGTQSRAEINQDVANEYGAEMKAGVKFPPITVFFDGDNYWCADGFHRVHGAMRVNIAKIAADVRQGTQRDAILYSVGVNADHGLRRSNADKRRAAMKLLEDEEWGKWSSYEIAKRCAVSHTFIDNLRSSLATVASENYPRTYTTKHGQPSTMQTGSIGKSSTVVRYESDADVDDETPDGIQNILFVPIGTQHGKYNFTDDGDPIIYADSFYPADYVKKLVIVEPFGSKDKVWQKYPKLQAIPGPNFNAHRATMLAFEYFAPDVYADHLAANSLPDPVVIEPVDPSEADTVIVEPAVEDGDTPTIPLAPVAPPLFPLDGDGSVDPAQLPFTQEEPNEPDPYEVTPFGRTKVTAKPESVTVSAETLTIIDTATSLRELADRLSNSGQDTPLSRWEAGRLLGTDPAPAEPPAPQPVDPRQNAINAFTSSDSVEWYTPELYIKAARTVMGDIDLDPASCDEAQQTVKARQYFTKENDGLAQKWHGRVWMNPPYGRDEDNSSTVEKWVARIVTAFIHKEIEQAVILVNATTDRAWFEMLWPFPICFVRKRIKFNGPNNTNGNPTIGSAIVYLGDNVPGFVDEFEQFGPIAFSTRMFRRNNVELADVFGELFYEEVRE